MNRIILVLSAVMIFSSSLLFAEENSVLSLKPEVQRGSLLEPQGLWPFLGLGMGIMEGNDTIRTGGIPTHFKVLGSYYFEAPWIADFGIGMHNHFLTQGGGDSDTIQSLYTELAARYEFTNRWQLGAIWNTLVDNPDRYKSNTENLASFMGVQVMKEFTWNNEFLVRAGGRAMTDVGISGETIDTVMAELEVSFGPAGTHLVQEPTPAPVAAPIVATPIAPHLDAQAMRTFTLDPEPVNFESDSTKLTLRSQAYLRRLARVLAANSEMFSTVEVVGHADQRGPDRYNDKLSVRRAQTVSSTLMSAGISKRQIKAAGKGERNLLTTSMTPKALSRNRRVQIEFEGVTNKAALESLIESVNR